MPVKILMIDLSCNMIDLKYIFYKIVNLCTILDTIYHFYVIERDLLSLVLAQKHNRKPTGLFKLLSIHKNFKMWKVNTFHPTSIYS